MTENAKDADGYYTYQSEQDRIAICDYYTSLLNQDFHKRFRRYGERLREYAWENPYMPSLPPELRPPMPEYMEPDEPESIVAQNQETG